jgi:hypothetical protein
VKSFRITAGKWLPPAGMSTWAALLLSCVLAIPAARADMVLVSDTTLVSGTQSWVYSFNVPGPGTITVQLSNLAWPQQLSALSFLASSAEHVMSSWSDEGGLRTDSFELTRGGTYFADIIATAQGPLDLGVYSLLLGFTPASAPVPLPESGRLLLGGALLLLALAWALRRSPAAAGVAFAG